jgi:hypothetical protein
MNESHMYKFRVACNDRLIASFQSKHQQEEFRDQRAKRFPKNVYTLSTKKD